MEPMEGSLNPSQGRGQGDCPREAGPPEPPRDPAHGSALQLRGRAGPASQRPAPRVWNTRLLVLPLGFCWSPHHITPATTMMSPSFPRQENLPVCKRHPAFGAKGRVSRPYLSLWLSVPCRAGLPQAQVPGCPGAAPPAPRGRWPGLALALGQSCVFTGAGEGRGPRQPLSLSLPLPEPPHHHRESRRTAHPPPAARLWERVCEPPAFLTLLSCLPPSQGGRVAPVRSPGPRFPRLPSPVFTPQRQRPSPPFHQAQRNPAWSHPRERI